MKLNVVIFRTVVLCLALVATLGCRRALHDNPLPPPTPPTVPTVPVEGAVPVEIAFDWSQSGLNITQMQCASARIFPESGGDPIEVVLTENLEKTTVWLVPGVYRAVGINETPSVGDWDGIDFSGLARCDDFSASMRLLSGSKAAESLVGVGSHLAVAPSERFEVTAQMVGQTPEQKPLTVAFAPRPATQQIRVVAHIQNLDNARSLTATLSGMYATRLLWSEDYTDQRAMHSFEFTSRTYDTDDARHGTIEAKFHVFKLVEGEDFTKKLSLTAKLLNGDVYQQDFEVTRRIELGELIYELKIGVRTDDVIILPIVPDGYVPVTFHLDWSLSGLSPSNGQVQRASVWVYPDASGEAPIELMVSPNVWSVSTHLKAGSYSVVAFNKSNNPSDWTGLDIVDEQAYATISGRVRSLPLEPPYTAKNVEPLVGATLGTLTVLENTPKTETLLLKPVTHLLEVRAKINNLDNARTVSCRLTGMAPGTVFCSNNDVVGSATHLFDPTDRVYDAVDLRNGVIQGTLYIFGDPLVAVVANQRMLHLDCTLLDNTVEPFSFDVGALIAPFASGYQVEVGTITLTPRPRLPIEGDPSVDDWNPEQNNPLK